MSSFTETLRARETGSAAEPTGFTRPTVLHSITPWLVRERALQKYSEYNVTKWIQRDAVRQKQANMTDNRDGSGISSWIENNTANTDWGTW